MMSAYRAGQPAPDRAICVILNRPALLTLGDTTIQPDAVISNLHELPDSIG